MGELKLSDHVEMKMNAVNDAIEQLSQTRGPWAACGPPTSREIQIFKEILSHLAYFLNYTSYSKYLFLLFSMWPASLYFKSHAARESL